MILFSTHREIRDAGFMLSSVVRNHVVALTLSTHVLHTNKDISAPELSPCNDLVFDNVFDLIAYSLENNLD